jgi:hypothetical protein
MVDGNKTKQQQQQQQQKVNKIYHGYFLVALNNPEIYNIYISITLHLLLLLYLINGKLLL